MEKSSIQLVRGKLFILTNKLYVYYNLIGKNMLRGRLMTIGSKFNVGLSNITIDRLTLLSYKIKLDDYIKKNNLWEENVIECWLYDLCDYALKQDVGLTYKTIRVLEDHWGFDTDKDDIDEFITEHMEKFMAKINR